MLDLSISINHYLVLSGMLFVIGLTGVFISRKNIITILMSIEIMLLSVNINFVAFSSFLNDISGQIFSIFIITISAAEAAIGLSILVIYYRNRSNVNIEDISTMKG